MSAATADLQLITGAGTYELDVLVRSLAPGELEVSGQVTTSTGTNEPVQRLTIALLDAEGRLLVAHTRTDALGEFTLRGLRTSRYVLTLGITRDAPRITLLTEGGCHADR